MFRQPKNTSQHIATVKKNNNLALRPLYPFTAQHFVRELYQRLYKLGWQRTMSPHYRLRAIHTKQLIEFSIFTMPKNPDNVYARIMMRCKDIDRKAAVGSNFTRLISLITNVVNL
jgi:hypothetical protein